MQSISAPAIEEGIDLAKDDSKSKDKVDETAQEPKVRNRWIVVIGAIMIQLALGAIYAWSAFTTPLQGTPASGTTPATVSEYGYNFTLTQGIFSAGLATFAAFTIIGGILMRKYGPMKIAILGGIILGLGYILGGLVGKEYTLKLATIGIMAGAGIGLAYVVPIATGVKWFPDKKGLVSGLGVAGFGLGSFMWILMASPPSVLHINGLITKQTVGQYSYTVANVDQCFMIYGAIFLIMVLIGSLFMKNPPAGWKPAGWNPPVPAPTAAKSVGSELKPKEMVKTAQYWLLVFMFLFGALAGLMVIGSIQNFAKNPTDGFQAHGFSKIEAADFAVIGAAVSLPIFNGIGRIVWGTVSDKIGRKRTFTAMFALQGVMMAALFYTSLNQYAFYVVTALIGFNFGGNFALFPAATADSFGNQSVGTNYGYVFALAYGSGGIAGPYIAAAVKDAGMSYYNAFIPAAVLCFVAAAIAFAYKTGAEKKKEKNEGAPEEKKEEKQ